MSLRTGSQLRAARALCDISQAVLASMAGVHVNTVRKIEAGGTATIGSGLDTVLKLQKALEDAGVEFIPENGGGVGVRLRKDVTRTGP